MATFKQFEDLPAWNAATDLAVSIFRLTSAPSFRYKGDLVNQLRRAVLSIPNNIAEGFERGTTAELITFLYIARGSASEVRSMLRFAMALGAMQDDADDIRALIDQCEALSRQLRAWLDSLQNSDIAGQRHLTDKSRRIYQEDKRAAEISDRLRMYRDAMEQQLRDGTFGTPDAEPLPSIFPSRPAASPGSAPTSAPESPPACPECGRAMVHRTSRDGKPFWGCSAYPQCRGHRNV